MHSLRATHLEGFNMEDIKIGNGSISIWGIIAAVGGLLAFISLFLAMTIITQKIGGVSTEWSDSISGLDMLTSKYNGDKLEDLYTFWRFMPLLAAIAGLATLVLAILPIFGLNNSGIKIAFMICGIVTLVLGILVFAFSAGGSLINEDYYLLNYEFSGSRQIGAYFSLIGGIVACAGACLDKFGVKF